MAITEDDIRDLATEQSYERGEEYYDDHSITSIQKRGETLIADVFGSSYDPYHVTIELIEDEIGDTSCTCPYDWGGICKHIVAVLLSYLHHPTQIKERPAIQELLSKTGEADLREVFMELLTSEPHLIEQVEAKLMKLVETGQEKNSSKKKKNEPMAKSSPSLRPAAVDVAPFRRQTQQILRGFGYGNSYDAGWDISGQISKLFDQAHPFLEAGDGRNALLLLEAIMEPFVDCWYEYDHEGEVGEVFVNVGSLFAEAILCADLSKDERQSWGKKLEEWQADISDYGVEEVFDAAIAAAEQGWEYPPLQAVLQGKGTNKSAWENVVPFYADDLAVACLHVLERQGRTDEYLYLAEAEGQTSLYLTMLVKVGRGEEALKYALQYARGTEEALALAQALREHDQRLEALNIAEHGLTLQGEILSLARWLRDFALEMSQPDVALKAARAAFSSSFFMEDYTAVESIAGTEWPSIKPELLAQLAEADYAYAKIDIYLHEGMLEDAIKAVDRQSYADYSTVEKVVDAVWQTHPDWAIRYCKAQAEPIMDGGKSKYYHHAVRWVEKAGRAYLAAKREEEWQRYLEDLIQKHTRKYSLRPKLEGLRRISL